MISPWPPFTHPVAPKVKEMHWKVTIHWRSAATVEQQTMTNDTMEDEMTTTTFASSFQSTPLLSNINHTNDIMVYAPTTTRHSSTS